MASNLAVRTASAAVMLGVFAGAVALGGRGLAVLFALVAAVVALELFQALLRPAGLAQWAPALLFAATCALGVWAPLFGLPLPPAAVFGLGCPAACAAFVLTQTIASVAEAVPRFATAALLALAAHCGLAGFAAAALASPGLAVAAFLAVVANDTFAYVWGKALGRHPLLSLSPSKTVEGFVLGGATTVALGGLVAPLLRLAHRPDLLPRAALVGPLLGAAASLVCPFGGFLASGVKRAFGLKDFSRLIPGHGGLADRFDCQVAMGALLAALRALRV